MSLAGRRMVEEYKTKLYPAWKAKLTAAAGFDVPIEIQWDTMVCDDLRFNELFPKIFFEPLFNAFKAITVDAMGKEALQKGLKKVTLSNTKNNGYPDAFTFENGVLTLDHIPNGAEEWVKERAQKVQELLEQAL